MADSPGEALVVALCAVLRGMTGARSPSPGVTFSYPNDPVVERIWVPEPPQVPHFAVLMGKGGRSTIKAIGGPGSNIEELLPLDIYATVSGDQQVGPETWVQRVKDDLLTTVLANASLGGLVSGIADDITWDSDQGEFGPQTQVVMGVTFKYRTGKVVA